MAFDSDRGVIVLFGTYSVDGSGNVSNGTWEWNGYFWSLRNASGPLPRQAPVLSYDKGFHATVLFGGHDDSSGTTETWEWDGSTWTKFVHPRSGPDVVAAMASEGFRTYLFGFSGSGIDRHPETWSRWGVRYWSWRSNTGPTDHEQFTMIHDFGRQRMVLATIDPCWSPEGECFDMWAWNGSAWEVLPGSANGPSGMRSLAYDGHEIISVGNPWSVDYPSYIDADTWAWDGGNWARRRSPDPIVRRWHAMAYDAKNAATVMFGGSSGRSYLGDTWHWDGDTWRFMADTGPSRREFHAMTYDSMREVTVLFGGMGPDYGQVAHCCPLSDTWEWDGVSWTAQEVQGPSARWRHSLAYDERRRVTVLFGGAEGPDYNSLPLNDTWQWDGIEWTQVSTTGPSPRIGHTMAYDSEREMTVLFGGATFDNEGYFSASAETWVWNGDNWKLRIEVGPSARTNHTMAFDKARGVIVIQGGYDENGSRLRDTWEWNGATWNRLAAMGDERFDHAMTYDGARETLVIYGGYRDDHYSSVVSELHGGFPPYDADHDCDIDLFDMAELLVCVGEWPLYLDCARFDTNGDGAVDVIDYARILSDLTGPK